MLAPLNNHAKLRIGTVALSVSSLKRGEGEAAVNWASWKSELKTEARCSEQLRTTSITSVDALVPEFLYSNSFLLLMQK